MIALPIGFLGVIVKDAALSFSLKASTYHKLAECAARRFDLQEELKSLKEEKDSIFKQMQEKTFPP